LKRLWKIAGIAMLVAVLGIAAVGVAAFAQGDTGTTDSPFDYVAKFKEALAGILGISVDEYDTAVDKAEQQVVDQAVSEGWLTEEQATELQSRLDRAPAGPGLGMGMDMGFGRMDKGPGGFAGVSLTSVAAEKLGMEQTDLLTELQNGKTIAALAEEKGVDAQTIVDAYLAQVKAKLDEKVANGDITQKQADYQLEQAKTSATEQLDSTWEGWRPDGRGHGGMMGHGMGGFAGVSLQSVAAEKLGMELTDLQTELQNGKTIAALAEEKGVDTQTIIDAYLAQVKEKLDEKVANGDITQAQADTVLEQAKTRATEQLDSTWEGFDHGGRHGEMMGSGMGGF